MLTNQELLSPIVLPTTSLTCSRYPDRCIGSLRKTDGLWAVAEFTLRKVCPPVIVNWLNFICCPKQGERELAEHSLRNALRLLVNSAIRICTWKACLNSAKR